MTLMPSQNDGGTGTTGDGEGTRRSWTQAAQPHHYETLLTCNSYARRRLDTNHTNTAPAITLHAHTRKMSCTRTTRHNAGRLGNGQRGKLQPHVQLDKCKDQARRLCAVLHADAEEQKQQEEQASTPCAEHTPPAITDGRREDLAPAVVKPPDKIKAKSTTSGSFSRPRGTAGASVTTITASTTSCTCCCRTQAARTAHGVHAYTDDEEEQQRPSRSYQASGDSNTPQSRVTAAMATVTPHGTGDDHHHRYVSGCGRQRLKQRVGKEWRPQQWLGPTRAATATRAGAGCR